jgi:lipoprotein signal peptidase
MQTARGTALTGPPEAGDSPASWRKVWVLLAVAAGVYIVDVVSKIVVVATLSGHAPVRLLGGLLNLLVLRNSGAAFSIGTSMTIVFTAIAVGVIGFILYAARRLRSLPWAIMLGLLLGGATGNLTDRLLRSPGIFRGDVVDWIQLPHWPVFNVADSAIVCGGVLAVLLAARGIHVDGTRDGHRSAAGRGKGPGDGTGGGPAAPGGRDTSQAVPRASRDTGQVTRDETRDRGSAAGDSRA